MSNRKKTEPEPTVLFTDDNGTEIKSDTHYYFKGVKSKMRSALHLSMDKTPKSIKDYTKEERSLTAYDLLELNIITEDQFLNIVEYGTIQP